MVESDENLDDHQYFQAIEKRFLELRGAPLTISPSDWRVAQKWNQAGIPLDLILRTLEEVFALRREQEADGRVPGLRYCKPAVEAAWRRVRDLQAPAARGTAPTEALDISARLERLATSLPAELPGGEAVAEAIRAAVGEPSSHQVEARLAQIEDDWLTQVMARQGGPELEAVERAVETRLETLAAVLPREELDTHRERLLRQKVRAFFGLPSLSIFAPEALPEAD